MQQNEMSFKNTKNFVKMTRSNRRRCSVRKVFLKNCAGKQPYWNLIFDKVAGLKPATLLKKRLQGSFFLVKFSKFLKAPDLLNICEQLLLDDFIINFLK